MADAVLDALRERLPPGWSMAHRADTIELSRAGIVWQAREARANAPASAQTAAEREARVKRDGIATRVVLRFRTEPRWTDEALAQARRHNTELRDEIATLADRHGLADRRSPRGSKSGGEGFIPVEPDDDARIRAYQAARAELESLHTPLPILDTDELSLFPAEHSGVDDAMSIVAPEDASREAYQVLGAIKELARISPSRS